MVEGGVREDERGGGGGRQTDRRGRTRKGRTPNLVGISFGEGTG